MDHYTVPKQNDKVFELICNRTILRILWIKKVIYMNILRILWIKKVNNTEILQDLNTEQNDHKQVSKTGSWTGLKMINESQKLDHKQKQIWKTESLVMLNITAAWREELSK